MRKLIQILAGGYILMYFSEHLFWARFRPGDSAAGFLMTWVAYSFLAYALLFLVATFHVRDFWSLFLAGAVVGWLGEGVIVQTMYNDFPLNLSFTGLAWHSLISVCAGWAGFNLLLRRRAVGGWIAACLALGVFWFFWGISWMFEEPATLASPLTFAWLILPTTALLALALYTSRWAHKCPVRFHRWEGILLVLVFGAVFVLGAVPRAGWLAISAPLLIGLSITALWRSSRSSVGVTLIEKMTAPYPASRLAILLLVPLTAIPLYAGLHALIRAFDLHLPTNWLVYALTMPAGFVLYMISLFRSFAGQRNAEAIPNDPIV